MLKTAGYALALVAAAAALPVAAAEKEAPVEVMILGTFHFANPGADLNNSKVDDVLAPRRQAELAALADRLAAFRPTKVAIENQPKTGDFTVPAYASFTPAELLKERNENSQIGFRVAYQLGHKAVYGYDEQPGPGEPDYFPFDKVAAYAKAHGGEAWLEHLFADTRAYIADFEKSQPTTTIVEQLAATNDPATILRMHRNAYYEMLKLGDGDAQPGADLNAMWYLRNAKMFGKIVNIAKPGDRVLVVVGSGHNYWLRHLVAETPGYKLIDPVPYLTGK